MRATSRPTATPLRAQDFAAGTSMASGLGVSRATKHYQLRYLYTEGLVVIGVVRLRKVPAKDSLVDLRTKFLPAEVLRYLCELHCMRSSSSVLRHQRHHPAGLPCSACVSQLHEQVPGLPLATCHTVQCKSLPLAFTIVALHVARHDTSLFVRFATCYSSLCLYVFVAHQFVHYGRQAARPTTSALVSIMMLGNNPMSLLARAVQERDKNCATFAVRHKQALDNCGHLLFVNRDCSAVAKHKYYGSFE